MHVASLVQVCKLVSSEKLRRISSAERNPLIGDSKHSGTLQRHVDVKISPNNAFHARSSSNARIASMFEGCGFIGSVVLEKKL
jgi:hypothetical protein